MVLKIVSVHTLLAVFENTHHILPALAIIDKKQNNKHLLL